MTTEQADPPPFAERAGGQLSMLPILGYTARWTGDERERGAAITAALREHAPAATAEFLAQDSEVWLDPAVSTIAARADVMQFAEDVTSADSFAPLLAAVVALAHQPCGVEFLGVHWCAGHYLCEAVL